MWDHALVVYILDPFLFTMHLTLHFVQNYWGRYQLFTPPASSDAESSSNPCYKMLQEIKGGSRVQGVPWGHGHPQSVNILVTSCNMGCLNSLRHCLQEE